MRFREPLSSSAELPQADSNREYQELSLRALRNLLPPSEFVLRDERAEDAGVDVSIELLSEGRYTNLRSQVQLKSTDSPREVADGSISLSVPVHNLNYLLNSPNSPLYVIYLVSRNELRFVWARDERMRLDQEAPFWQQQQTVTLHFEKVLDGAALSRIRTRIEAEARLQAEIHEVLGRSSGGEVVRVCIERETLRSTDPEKQLEIILEQGITLSNVGRASEVIDAVAALNPKAAQQARVQLVVGYAHYVQSHLTLAIAAFSQAVLKMDALCEDDRQFLICLRDVCDYYTGRTSFFDFAQKVGRWQQKTATSASFAVGFKLDELRHRLHDASSVELDEIYDVVRAKRQIVDEIRAYVKGLESDTSIPPILQYQAFAFWMQSEGMQLAAEDKIRWSQAAMRGLMGQNPIIENILRESTKMWRAWETLVDDAIREARKFGHPLCLADVLLGSAVAWYWHLLGVRVLSQTFG